MEWNEDMVTAVYSEKCYFKVFVNRYTYSVPQEHRDVWLQLQSVCLSLHATACGIRVNWAVITT
jgi:hypothetical protein